MLKCDFNSQESFDQMSLHGSCGPALCIMLYCAVTRSSFIWSRGIIPLKHMK